MKRHSKGSKLSNAAARPERKVRMRRTSKKVTDAPANKTREKTAKTPQRLPKAPAISPTSNTVPSSHATGPTLLPPPLVDQNDPAAELETRIQVSFDKFAAELFDTPFITERLSSIRRVARATALSSQWRDGLAAYMAAVFGGKDHDGLDVDEESLGLNLLNLALSGGGSASDSLGSFLELRTPIQFLHRASEPPQSPHSSSSGSPAQSPFTLLSNTKRECSVYEA